MVSRYEFSGVESSRDHAERCHSTSASVLSSPITLLNRLSRCSRFTISPSIGFPKDALKYELCGGHNARGVGFPSCWAPLRVHVGTVDLHADVGRLLREVRAIRVARHYADVYCSAGAGLLVNRAGRPRASRSPVARDNCKPYAGESPHGSASLCQKATSDQTEVLDPRWPDKAIDDNAAKKLAGPFHKN